MSLPICRASDGLSATRSTAVGSSGSTMSWPCQFAVDDRLHVRAVGLGRGVHVGDEADDRHVRLLRRRRHRWRRRSRARRARRPSSPIALQLLDQQVEQHELLRGAGVGLGVLVGLGVVRDVAQEALECGGLQRHGELLGGVAGEGNDRPEDRLDEGRGRGNPPTPGYSNSSTMRAASRTNAGQRRRNEALLLRLLPALVRAEVHAEQFPAGDRAVQRPEPRQELLHRRVGGELRLRVRRRAVPQCRSPSARTAPVTAPQVSPVRARPPPKPEARRSAVSRLTSAGSANAVNTDCAQEKSCSNVRTACSTRSIVPPGPSVPPRRPQPLEEGRVHPVDVQVPVPRPAGGLAQLAEGLRPPRRRGGLVLLRRGEEEVAAVGRDVRASRSRCRPGSRPCPGRRPRSSGRPGRGRRRSTAAGPAPLRPGGRPRRRSGTTRRAR